MMNFGLTLLLSFMITAAGCASKKTSPKEPALAQLKVTRIGPDANLRESFRLNLSDCQIQFDVTSKRDKSSFHILVMDSCGADRASRAQEYAVLLNAIFKTYPKKNLDTLSSNSFYKIHLWDEKIAMACMKSDKWADFQANRNKIGAANAVFVEVFNEAEIGAEIRHAFQREGLNIELARVEKVMESKAKDLPFASKYPELKDSTRRICFSAGLYFFRPPQL